MTLYISPGDPNLTPNQIRELQDSLNAQASEKVIVLPPGSKLWHISDDDRVSELLHQVRKGLMSVDEARRQLRLKPWGLPETGR